MFDNLVGLALKLFECVWPFCDVGTRVKQDTHPSVDSFFCRLLHLQTYIHNSGIFIALINMNYLSLKIIYHTSWFLIRPSCQSGWLWRLRCGWIVEAVFERITVQYTNVKIGSNIWLLYKYVKFSILLYKYENVKAFFSSLFSHFMLWRLIIYEVFNDGNNGL